MLKCIYLCAREHRLDDIDGVDFWYNDIEEYPGIDFVCDALAVDLDCFDLLIATPPCNYWSRANYLRETSEVAQSTKHLLPELLAKFKATGKPFLIENVQNWNLMKHFAAEYPVVYWGNHTWFTNMLVPLPSCPPVHQINKKFMSYGHRDNNPNVDIYIRNWVSYVKGVI